MLRIIMVMLLTLAVTGCAQKTKLTDASNYLLIQSELVKLKTYRESILSCRDELVCVPINYKADLTEPPVPNFIGLTSYLNKNDCTTPMAREDYLRCYGDARIKLIQTTEKLDAAELDNYVLNRTITRLIKNIDVIINSFPEVQTLPVK